MKNLLLLLVLLCVAVPAHAADKDSTYDGVMKTGTLKCGYFVWPPYLQKDAATGKLSGIYYDVIEALGQTLNIKIDWAYEYTLGQQVEALKSGKADALCADGPWTRSAMPFLDYSHPYMFIPGYIYVAPGNPKKLTLQSLNSSAYKFTAIDGDGSGDYLSVMFPKAQLLGLPSTADPSLLVENIMTGKADAEFNDPLSIETQKSHNAKTLTALDPGHPLATYPFVISLPKAEMQLMNMLNQGIDLMNDNGRLRRIIRGYDAQGKNIKLPAKRYEN